MDNTTVSLHNDKWKKVTTVLILFFINLINYMDRYTIAGVLEDVKSYYTISNGSAGFIQTSFIISYMITAPIFGYFGDRYNRRYLLAIAVIGWSITTLLGSFIPPQNFGWFLFLRALVGIGEAGYSTIAPTIIADLYVDDMRSSMLALFYFAIPVGSGLGYIVGSTVTKALGHWHWALRITPLFGMLCAVLCLTVLLDPARGEIEGISNTDSSRKTLKKDIKDILKNCSLIWTTLGFSCVTFSIGALAWWAPSFMSNALQISGAKSDPNWVGLIFGIIACLAGVIGVLSGSYLSQFYRKHNSRADPIICSVSILLSVPMIFLAIFFAHKTPSLTWSLIFFGQTFLSMTWPLITDLVMSIVIPSQRSFAASFQIMISHLLGDASSPYIVGLVSDLLQVHLQNSFLSQQYALLIMPFVLLLGSLCFTIVIYHIQKDRKTYNQMLKNDKV